MREELGKTWRYPMERQHVVSNPTIFSRDIDIQRRMFIEAAISMGVIVDFYRCCSDKSDFYNDANCKWEEPVKLPVIFDEHPRVKILKALGWYTEDDERPTLLYLPMYKDWILKEILDVRENSLVRIHYFGQNIPSEFRITEKKMDSVYGVHWVCKLAPERMDEFSIIEEKGRHFLKRVKRDMDCSHDMDENADNRKFVHDGVNDNITEANSSDYDYYDLITNGKSENTVDKFDYYEDKDYIDGRDDNEDFYGD